VHLVIWLSLIGYRDFPIGFWFGPSMRNNRSGHRAILNRAIGYRNTVIGLSGDC